MFKYECFENTVFKNLNLKITEFNCCHFKGTVFLECELRDIIFNKCSFKAVSFRDCVTADLWLISCEVHSIDGDIIFYTDEGNYPPDRHFIWKPSPIVSKPFRAKRRWKAFKERGLCFFCGRKLDLGKSRCSVCTLKEY